MRALLNGKAHIILHHPVDEVTAEYWPGGTGEIPYLTIARPQLGWKAQLDGVRPNHLRPPETIMENDFQFFFWEAQNMLCVAGHKRFFAIRGESGQISQALDLEFTNKSSLDFMEILASLSGDKLIVVSTKVAWLLKKGGENAEMIEIPGLTVSLTQMSNGFLITYLDTSDIMLPKKTLTVA